jgi:hypothetical protein
MDANTTGGNNVAVGQAALGGNTTASFNTALGVVALESNTTGASNTAFGFGSLATNTTAGNNTAVGKQALRFSTGANNTALGTEAGDTITTGTNNIVIGNAADASSATVSNEITLGNSSVTRFRIPGIDVDLTSAPWQPLLKGTSYTASSGEFVVATAGSITITLPASPSAGDYVIIKDGTGAAATTSFTVARNGSNIASSATDLTFNVNFDQITMIYIDATIGWSV